MYTFWRFLHLVVATRKMNFIHQPDEHCSLKTAILFKITVRQRLYIVFISEAYSSITYAQKRDRIPLLSLFMTSGPSRLRMGEHFFLAIIIAYINQ